MRWTPLPYLMALAFALCPLYPAHAATELAPREVASPLVDDVTPAVAGERHQAVADAPILELALHTEASASTPHAFVSAASLPRAASTPGTGPGGGLLRGGPVASVPVPPSLERPELPQDLGGVAQLILAAVGGDLPWYVAAAIGLFLLVQITKGKAGFTVPLLTGFLEGLKPFPRLLVIVIGTIGAFALLGYPGGGAGLAAGAIVGLQVAAGAVLTHLGWKTLKREPVGAT